MKITTKCFTYDNLGKREYTMEYRQKKNQSEKVPLTLGELNGVPRKIEKFQGDILDRLGMCDKPDEEVQETIEKLRFFLNMPERQGTETAEDIAKSFIASPSFYFSKEELEELESVVEGYIERGYDMALEHIKKNGLLKEGFFFKEPEKN